MGCGCSAQMQMGYDRIETAISRSDCHQTLYDKIPAETLSLTGSRDDISVHEVEDEPMDVRLDEVRLLSLENEDQEEALPRQYSSYFKYDQPEMVRVKEQRTFYPPVNGTTKHVFSCLGHLADDDTQPTQRSHPSVLESEEFELISFPEEAEVNVSMVQRTHSIESTNDNTSADGVTRYDSYDDRILELSRNLNELQQKSNMDLSAVRTDTHEELIPVISDFIAGLIRNSELHLQTEKTSNCNISMSQLCVYDRATNTNLNNRTKLNLAHSSPEPQLDNFYRAMGLVV